MPKIATDLLPGATVVPTAFPSDKRNILSIALSVLLQDLQNRGSVTGALCYPILAANPGH
jgi:hypothetical protein